ncbi:MAG: zinc ribbon domain-containing protein [Vicinamibacteria bacterium]|nr:zinc ribbon domain-containing protein [Vicinamibacteria bacterium]
MTACPKCGKAVEPSAQSCPVCGVILSKARAVARPVARPVVAAPAASPPPSPPDRSHASPLLAALKVGLAAAAGIAALVAIQRMRQAPVPTTAPGLPRATVAASVLPTIAPEGGTLSQDDVAFLNALSLRLARGGGGAMPTDQETGRVEQLQAANRDSEPLRNLLMGIYLRRADRDLQAGSFAQVDQTLGKMRLVDDREPQIYLFEAQARARQNDWAGALSAAQKFEGMSGEATPSQSFLVAVSLEKLGRRPDALAVLDRPVFETCATATDPADVSACTAARQMRQAFLAADAPAPAAAIAVRQRETLVVDPSKEQIQSDRFDVRFDGESQSGVARDVLFVLDRAYTRLTDVYYDRPARKIPVVLHSSQDYYTRTGAPWWSGGVYSSHNGAIQIPVRGLPSTLPREMEDVLVHELSHAFVDDMSGGFAGRDLQEGLAQYMEGKRIEDELGLDQLKRLANSNGQSVGSFYMISLAISEQLVRSRGQGMVNQLLKAMKETGSEDGGFRKVFGQSGTAMRKDILETFWRRYS